jgi:hypothetical protein
MKHSSLAFSKKKKHRAIALGFRFSPFLGQVELYSYMNPDYVELQLLRYSYNPIFISLGCSSSIADVNNIFSPFLKISTNDMFIFT